MSVAHGSQLITRPREQRLDAAADLLAMLQRARRLEGDARHCGALRNRIYGNDFAEIPGQRGNARRLLAILRVLREQMPVLLDGDAAAARRDDERLDAAACDHWPPRVDDRAHVIAAGFLAIEVEANAAAAAGAGRFKERHAEPVENPRRRSVDAGRECRLDATSEHQHLSPMARRRPRPGSSGFYRYFRFQRSRQERPE